MQLHRELTYDASPDQVHAMLADPAFRARVCDAQGVVSHEITVEEAGAGFVLRIEQVQDTAGLPAIARKITGETTRAIVEERWDGPTSGRVTITAPGKPTSAQGTITLSADGERTTQVVELEVTVKVPLVGAKLETLMIDTITSGLAVEQTVGAAWLAGEN